MHLQSILCPVDFSEASRQALRYAADLSHRSGARLSVLFVNDPLFLATAAAALHRRPRMLEQTERELERFVTTSVPAASHAADIACVIGQGTPALEILSNARHLKSDLITMGTHGVRGFNRLFLGSTTERVFRRTTVPLLAVPVGKTRGAVARVVMPVDPAGRWAETLTAATAFSRLYGAGLALVHVVPRTQVPPWLRDAIAAHDRDQVLAARRALEPIRAAVAPDIEVTSRILIGNPAHEVAAFVEKSHAGLIVMSVRRDPRARVGSMTQQLLTHGVAPVLAVTAPA